MASLLDTDVVSQWSKPVPDAQVASWLATVVLEETYLSVVTIQELRTGIERLPAGRKRSGLEMWLGDFVLVKYEARILPVTLEIADICGRILGSPNLAGFHPENTDAYIAATARVHGLEVATLNRKHFEKLGVELVEF